MNQRGLSLAHNLALDSVYLRTEARVSSQEAFVLVYEGQTCISLAITSGLKS